MIAQLLRHPLLPPRALARPRLDRLLEDALRLTSTRHGLLQVWGPPGSGRSGSVVAHLRSRGLPFLWLDLGVVAAGLRREAGSPALGGLAFLTLLVEAAGAWLPGASDAAQRVLASDLASGATGAVTTALAEGLVPRLPAGACLVLEGAEHLYGDPWAVALLAALGTDLVTRSAERLPVILLADRAAPQTLQGVGAGLGPDALALDPDELVALARLTATEPEPWQPGMRLLPTMVRAVAPGARSGMLKWQDAWFERLLRGHGPGVPSALAEAASLPDLEVALGPALWGPTWEPLRAALGVLAPVVEGRASSLGDPDEPVSYAMLPSFQQFLARFQAGPLASSRKQAFLRKAVGLAVAAAEDPEQGEAALPYALRCLTAARDEGGTETLVRRFAETRPTLWTAVGASLVLGAVPAAVRARSAWCHLLEGEAWRQLGATGEGEAALERSVLLAEANQDPACLGRALASWSALLGEAEDDRQGGVAGRAVELLPAREDPMAAGFALNSLGVYHLRHDQANQALQRFTEAEAAYRAAGEPGGVVRALHNQAVVCRKLGDLLEAARASEEAVRLATASGRIPGPLTLNNLALVRFHELDLAGAWSWAEQALRAACRLDARREEAHAGRTLGQIALRAGALAKASEFLHGAMELAASTGDRRHEGRLLWELAMLCRRQGKPAAAARHEEKALARAGANAGAPAAAHEGGPPAPWPLPLALSALGPLVLRAGGRPLPIPWAEEPEAAMVLLRLLRTRRGLRRAELADWLQGTGLAPDVDAALSRLHALLREALPLDLRWTLWRDGRCVFNWWLPCQVDVELFAYLLREARDPDLPFPDREARFEEAARMLGTFGEDFPADPWAAGEARGLAEDLAWTDEVLHAPEESPAAAPSLLDLAERQLANSPLIQWAHRARLRALASMGRREEAIQRYQELVEALGRVGVAPEPATEALFLEITRM